MEINIKVDLGYDERRDKFFLADFEVVKTDDQTEKAPQKKSAQQPGSQRECKQNG
jgi:hypothetical protein